MYVINRDPFRSIRRGRQLFQRKFTRLQGQGVNEKDGVGDINSDIAIGAGLSDSCALCHGHPRGSAGAGGNVVTRPDSRDAGHLFGLGLKEMLADEISTDLRSTHDLAATLAQQLKKPELRQNYRQPGRIGGQLASAGRGRRPARETFLRRGQHHLNS